MALQKQIGGLYFHNMDGLVLVNRKAYGYHS